jgi:FtsZ-interacting cell division protein ZipA
MSILLESLNQTKQSAGISSDKGVPSLDDSHFDDEMLSDEWLLKKLVFWKMISGILLVALLASWFGTYFYLSNPENKIDMSVSELKENSATEVLQNQPEKNTDEQNILKPVKIVNDNRHSDKDNNQEAERESTEQLQNNSNQVKQTYKPKKIATPVSAIYTEKKTNKRTSQENASVKDGSDQTASDQNTRVVEFESLTESEQQQLPGLEISSYAVSSNTDKSFVVLNGAFYGQGETIAPYLELISIDKEGILIRYKGRLIRKKYSL